MNIHALYHTSESPYLNALSDHVVKIRLRAQKGDLASCLILHADRYLPTGNETSLQMKKTASTELHDYYEVEIQSDCKRIRYAFLVTDHEGKQCWYGEQTASEWRDAAGEFQCPMISAMDRVIAPAWIEDAIVYQIFPDRFYNGDKSNDPAGTDVWENGVNPTRESYYGGDLEGIRQKLPYLQELGITLLYMTPIFASDSNHKYDTIDYYRIDPSFGDTETMARLVKEAHELGIRVMLDAVFNHSGDRFFAFQDVIEKGEQSAYADWYHIHDYPVQWKPETNYETFGRNVKTMPKLNTRNEALIKYLLDVAEYWIRETDIDGWRIDVANEVDHDFWRVLRRRVKKVKPDALIIGEIMHGSGIWLKGDQFDGVMNYLLRDAMVEFFAKQTMDVHQFASRIDHVRMMYSDQANYAMFNVMGSHDTKRFITACLSSKWGWGNHNEIARLKLAAFYMITFVGMPMIYYGDEIGMYGGEDPDCRRTMIWDRDERQLEVFSYYQKMIKLRKQLTALRIGSYQRWFEDSASNVLGYIRSTSTEAVGCILNSSPMERELTLTLPYAAAAGGDLVELLSGDRIAVGNDGTVTVRLKPYSAFLLKLQ